MQELLGLACSFDEEEWRDWLPGLAKLEDLSKEELDSVRIVLVANPSSLPYLPRLCFVQSLWAGVDKLLSVLAPPQLGPEVLVARMIDPYMIEAMTQTVVWSVLHVHRLFHDYLRQQRQGEWKKLHQRRADEMHVLVAGGTGQVCWEEKGN